MNGRFSKEYIEALAHKYRSGTLTPQEQADFEAWYTSKDDGTFAHSDAGDPRRVMRRMYSNIRGNTRPTTVRRIRRWLPYAAAVIIVLTATWVFLGPELNLTSKIVTLKSADIPPGGNRATLTLADGRTIDLSEEQTGIVIGDENITYNDGSSLDVLSSEAEGRRDISLLELTTPKGGTYQVTLPDGTNVWLNSASTLKYPSRFSDEERVVELTGEAYFDVSERWSVVDDQPLRASGDITGSQQGKKLSAFAPLRKNKTPFKVITHGQTVEVLGTQFNISAYPDEPETQTTLVEGAVRLRAGATGASVPLVPGEQGLLINNVIQTKTVDVTQYTAWKDGDIVLTGVPLPSLLRQIARWYNVEVEIGSDPGSVEFFGTVSRQRKLSSVLEAMEATGKLRFQLAGNKLIVNPK